MARLSPGAVVATMVLLQLVLFFATALVLEISRPRHVARPPALHRLPAPASVAAHLGSPRP
jgi:hypothetical protein